MQNHRNVLIVGILCVVLRTMDVAEARPTRHVLKGTVTGILNPSEIATGVRVGDPIAYTIVLDFREDARVDGVAITGLRPRSNPEAVVTARFADIVQGQFLGTAFGVCEGDADFGLLFDRTIQMIYAFEDPSLAGAFPPAAIVVGSAHDHILFNIVDFDGTVDSLRVGSGIVATEVIQPFSGCTLSDRIIIRSSLTLGTFDPIFSADRVGNVGSIVGRITDAIDGSRITCAAVTASLEGVVKAAGPTDQDGHYAIRKLGFDTYEVEVFAPGYESKTFELDLQIVREVVNFELMPETFENTITGRISHVDADTGAVTPLAGTRVDARDASNVAILSTFTCADGTYQLRGLTGKGAVDNVWAEAPGFFVEEQPATVGDTVDLPLDKLNVPGSIVGVVTSTDGGTPIIGAVVSVQGLTTRVSFGTETGDTGAFVILGVLSGEYSIHVSAPLELVPPGFKSATITVQVIGASTIKQRRARTGYQRRPYARHEPGR